MKLTRPDLRRTVADGRGRGLIPISSRGQRDIVATDFRANVLLAIAIALLNAACQPAPKSARGLAALTVRVIAEPKSGYTAPSDSDAYSMGQPAGDSDDRFARVNYRELRDIIVSVHPLSSNAGTQARPDATPQMDRAAVSLSIHSERPNRPRSSEIAGPVIGAAVGARIAIRNSTSAPHEVYSLAPGNEFDLGTVAPGASAEAIIQSPGLIEVLSASRDAPIGWVYAVDTPWVQTVTARSNLVLTNLPPGEYEIRSWHPRLPGESRAVRLEPDRTERVELRVGVDQLQRR